MILSDCNEIVRQELKKRLGSPLPRGIYAGGALSSIVLGTLWGQEIPSTDLLELYRNHPDPVDNDKGFVMRYTGAFKDGSPFKEGYTVLSTHVENNVRTNICFDIGRASGEEGRSLHIVRGLGLNALQVAYYACGTGEGSLFASDDFFEFAKSRQLRITCPIFPQSFFELARYQKLFNAYVDWNEEAFMMAGFREAHAGNAKAYVGLLAHEDKLLFDEHQATLSPYCRIIQLTASVLPGFESVMKSRWKIDFIGTDTSDMVREIRQACVSSRYCLTSYTYKVVFDILVRKSTRSVVRKRFRMVLKSPDASFFVMNDPKFLNNDFTESHLLEIDTFSSCHPQAMNVINRFRLDFISQVKAIRLLKKMGRIHGSPDFVIGLVERSKSYGIELKEITEQSINELVSAYASIGSSKMIVPADLSQFKYKDAVVELTSNEGLFLEGVRCSNCIGGYHGAVVKGAGNVRIFHLNTPGSNRHSTAAMYNHGTDNLDFDYEVYGPGNTDASDEHQTIAVELAFFLKDTIWKTDQLLLLDKEQ